MDGETKRPPRPHINVHFKCCNVYARVYLDAKGGAFAGHCPRCATPVRLEVSDDGDPGRFWSVG